MHWSKFSNTSTLLLPQVDWEQDTAEADLGADHWAYLDRTERPVGVWGWGPGLSNTELSHSCPD